MAMTETPSKRELQREERRGQILDAALTVFTQKGFHAANVSDVAALAGVSQGTIYWYFDSKEELFKAATLSVFVDFGREAQAHLDGCESATEKLQVLGQAMEGFVTGLEGLLVMFLGYWVSVPGREEAGRFWVDILVEYNTLLAEIVEQGIRDGEFRPVDAEALAWALMGAYDGLAAYTMLVPDMDVGRVSQVLVETLLHGLTRGVEKDESG
jgi:AcrR family transcriptional regulator